MLDVPPPVRATMDQATADRTGQRSKGQAMAQTHDIEDVLSSIRRLVANEAGPAAKPRAPEATARPDGPTLVLSDSHRVTEPEDPFQMIRTLAQEERDGRDAEHLTDALPEEVTAIVTDLTDAASGKPAWTRDDGSEAPRHGATGEDAGAAQGPVVSQVPEGYTEDADYDADAVDAAGDDIPFHHQVSKTDEMDRAAPRDLSDLSTSMSGDDALRDLISEIVRQELAGDLGERITRNVRKLVRREIRQMLASDEFD